jgi:phage major head subunit gpT-like protein
VHAIVRIPTKIAHAAVVTVNEQISNLFTQSSGTGPVMSDTYHVFDASNHQSNTSNSTPSMDLSSSSLQTAMTALEKIQNSAGKRIGVRGRYLLIPPDLRWTAAVITQSQYAAGTANNDINPLAGAVVPIVVPQFTTAYQWYLLADPSQVESIEIGFLNGREEPELLVQDNPTQGAVFTNDAISYKVRHIYGCGWLDYRGAYAALPTS